MLVVIGVSAILAMAVCALTITTYSTFGAQLRQDEVTARCRILLAGFTTDAVSASQVIYVGAGPYTPPTLPSGQSYTYPKDGAGQTQTTVPAATKLVVFAVPSYNASGTIPAVSDYVGYGWNSTAGTVVRTCIPNSQSSRPASDRIVPEGGQYDSGMGMDLHVASSYPNTTYADQDYDIGAKDGTGAYLFEGSSPSIGVQNVDKVDLDATVAAKSWGQTVSMELKSEARMRNWRQP